MSEAQERTRGSAAPTVGALVVGALAIGAGFLAARRELPRLGSSTPTKPAGPASTLKPAPGSSPMYGRAPIIAERLKRLAPEAAGEQLSPAMLEILLAQAALESGIAEAGVSGWGDDIGTLGIYEPAAYGLLLPFAGHAILGWTGAMKGSGNLGARQCNQSEQSGAPLKGYYTCEAYEDSSPQSDGTQKKYSVKFRYYRDFEGRPAGDWAAYDFLQSIAKDRPTAWAALKTGDVRAYADALYRTKYYQGFGATEAERIGTYVKALSRHLPALAFALGHDRVFASA